MPLSQPSNSSHCVPGAISNGPISGRVSTVGQVEGERVQAPALSRRLRRREVAVPRLVGGAREGNVEADLDDPVVGPEHRLAHRDEPGVGDDVDEAADPLGVDLDVAALGPARQRAARDRRASSNSASMSSRMRVGPVGPNAPLRPMMPSP